MPLVWRNRGLLLFNHAMSLQKQSISGSAWLFPRHEFLYLVLILIDCRGHHSVMQKLNQLTLLHDRRSPDPDSFARKRPRRSPHPSLRRHRSPYSYGHPLTDALTSIGCWPRQFLHPVRGSGSPNSVPEEMPEVSERGSQDHQNIC